MSDADALRRQVDQLTPEQLAFSARVDRDPEVIAALHEYERRVGVEVPDTLDPRIDGMNTQEALAAYYETVARVGERLRAQRG